MISPDKFLISLSVSQYLKNSQITLGKPQIWRKTESFAKIIKNQEMLVFVPSTDLEFCS